MKRSLLPLILIIPFLFAGCYPEKKELTQDEINKEKEAIEQVIRDYQQAQEEKNFSKMVPSLAGEVVFFGTDSSEVFKTFAEYKQAMNKQWERYDNTDYGEISEVSIQMDKNATFASIIYGVPCDIYKDGESQHLYLRIMRTLKKENEKWVIVGGIVSAVRPDDSFVIDKSNGEQETEEDTD